MAGWLRRCWPRWRACWALAWFPDLLARPLGGPLGYSNATGSFFLLAAAATLVVALRVPGRRLRWAAGTLAVAFAAVPWLNGTTSAAALSLLLPVAAVAGRRPGGTRATVVAAAALAAGALIVTVAVGVTYDPHGDRDRPAAQLWDATLSERRAQLWHDALGLLASRPLTGVGPGNFAAHGRTALAERDASWAHHELLQIGAETGALGLLLALGVGAWGFARLWWGAQDAGNAVAAVAYGALVVHSCVDYVLHFTSVGAAAAVLLAAGSALPRLADPGPAQRR